jgi:hypothetical protein
MLSQTRVNGSAVLRGPRMLACVVVFVLAAVSLHAPAARAWLPPGPGKDPGCTIVEPTHRMTLEVTIPDSFEFCPMLARALSEDVLELHVGITQTRWHYAHAGLTCRLHQAPPLNGRRITVYNSRRACHWLAQSGWIYDL